MSNNEEDTVWDNESIEITNMEGIDSEFQKKLLTAKHRLYHSIIFAPALGTTDAHNPELLQLYLTKLNAFYELAIQAQNSHIHDIELYVFPKKSRTSIRAILDWITNYFHKNKIMDTNLYTKSIISNLHTYQYVQNFILPN
jgi:hypothetical protein